ncbi:MAG: hypothetical protein M1828_005757 [Chrysothrix sp. TS-e1954]|nr:MAG: hypothetical protein M1828_005757 [Chrysothrix sp. TS-e1954]
MPVSHKHLSNIRSLLPSNSLLESSHPDYRTETATWAAQRNQKPSICVRPQTLEELQRIVKYLCSSDLDFVVRNGGAGSASSRDVVISLSKFDTVEFTKQSDQEAVALVGAGQTWGDVDLKMEEKAPGYVVVGTRTPLVGITGSILIGGLSWLAHEYGMIADPANLLDAQVVLPSGECIWAAKSAPDLMWALRGGRFSGGVISALRFRARKYPSHEIYAGPVTYPMSSLPELSKRINEFCHKQHDPRTAFMGFFSNPHLSWFPAPEGIVLMLFDAHGEAHGRSSDGFKWALDIPGAEDETKTMRYCDVGQLQASAMAGMGTSNNHMATLLLPDESFTEKSFRDCYEWFDDTITRTFEGIEEAMAPSTFIILEQMQPNVFLSVDHAKNPTAWPHPARHTHIIQLGTGYTATGNADKDASLQTASLKLLGEGCKAGNDKYEINGSGNRYHSERTGFTPTFLEEGLMSMEGVYGRENWTLMQDIASKYDPGSKFRGGWTVDGWSQHGR